MLKKILYIVEAMGGGIFTYIVNLSNELAKKYDIYLAYSIRPQTPKNYKMLFDDKVHFIEVKNFGREINPLKDIRAMFEIKTIVERVKPDIIHLHSSKAGVIGRIALKGVDIPLFYTPHGYSFLMADQNKMKRLLYKSIEWVCAREDCTTISCSFGEYEETLKLTKKAAYVSNAINPDEIDNFLNDAKQEKENEFTVFTIGRICCQKNPVLFNSIAEKMPDIKFLWIGDGELKHELKSKNIKVTGWVDRKRALELSINANVFILTSLWEGLPISLLEAMYMKKLCIVSDIIGNHDVVHNGYNGFVCKKAEEYVERIRNAMVTDQNMLVDNAYLTIKQNYTISIMAKEYDYLYNSKLVEGNTGDDIR